MKIFSSLEVTQNRRKKLGLRHRLLALVAVPLLAFSSFAQAQVLVDLALCMDGSGSIAPGDFTLQKTATVAALTTQLPIDGTVRLSVYQFSQTIIEELAPLIIDSAQDKTDALAAISAMVQEGSVTNTQGCILAATTALGTAGADGAKKILDVSTDGVPTYTNSADNCVGDAIPNTCSNAALAASTAAEAGGVVDSLNVIAVGDQLPLDYMDDLPFPAPVGSPYGDYPLTGDPVDTDGFIVPISSFEAYEDAIAEKLFIELDAPKLTVNKVVVNGATGGTAVVGDFNLLIGALQVVSGDVNTVTEGAHVVSEDAVAGYTGVISGDCDASGNVTVAAGESKVCTITNTAQQPTLTVTKVVVNGATGGTAVVGDFDIRIDGGSVVSGAANNVTTGAHTVSEVALAGYTGVIGGPDCDAQGNVTLALGENKSCTITNTAQQPTLTVTKVVVGGAMQPGDFTIRIDGGSVVSGAANNVTAGAHTVSEVPVADYNGVISGDCAANGSVTLALGENKSCTITNIAVIDEPEVAVPVNNYLALLVLTLALLATGWYFRPERLRK